MSATTTASPQAHSEVPDAVAPQRHPGRWGSGVLLLGAAGLVIRSVLTNPNIDWTTVGEFLFSSRILEGLGTTLELTVVSMIIGTVVGLVVALLRLSRNPIAEATGSLYVWLFRGTPLLVQVLLWGNFALFYDRIGIGVPFTNLAVSYDTNAVITTFVASVLALALHVASYMAEIIRAGVLSVDEGQTRAALALGLSRGQLLRRVVLPQALRVIVPPSGSAFIQLLKMTSLVAVIAGGDLLTQTQNIAAVNLRTIELLIVATLWYLLVTSFLSIGQAMLERYVGRGFGEVAPKRLSRALGRLAPGEG